MSRASQRFILAISLAAALLSGSASAANPADERKALELFQQGREAFDKGDVDTACALLEESLRLVEAAGTLLNIAQCEEKRLQFAKARAYWKRAHAQLEPTDERRPLTEERLHAVEKELGRIAIATDGKRSTLRVNDVDATVEWSEANRGEVYVSPGRHRVVVDGGAPLVVVLAAGETKEIDTRAKPTTDGGAPAVTDEGPSALLVSGIVVAGVGVLSLGGFAVTGGVIASNDGAIDEACPNKRCSPEGLSLIDDNETLLPVNAALLGVGIAGVGVGALLIILGVPASDPAPVSLSVDPFGESAFLTTTVEFP